MRPPITSNVKIHFILEHAGKLREKLKEIKNVDLGVVDGGIKVVTAGADGSQGEVSFGHNYVVLRTLFHVFVIFQHAHSEPDSAFVNATKIRSFHLAEFAVSDFCNFFGYSLLHIVGLKVDCSTSSGQFKIDNSSNIFDLKELKHQVNSLNENNVCAVKASLNPRYPNRIICRFEGLGTLLFFSNAKFNILGPKCQLQIDRIYCLMMPIIHKVNASMNLHFAAQQTLKYV